MKQVKLNDAEKFNNSDKWEVLEYPLSNPDINCATAVITGRYPDKGNCVNEQCKELIYVIDGSGTLNKQDEVIGTIGVLKVSIEEIKMNSLYVNSDYRQLGIAKELYEILNY